MRIARFRSEIVITIGLTVLTLVSFARVCQNELIDFDDNVYISDNKHVFLGLTWANVVWAWTTFHAGYWQPLTWMSLQLDAQVLGHHAWGYHLTNLGLHLANVLLLYFLLRRLTGALWASAIAAAFWAVHPLRVESVAWATERKDVLSTFFGLLAIWAYHSWVLRPDLIRYLAVLGWFTLSLLAKPMMVTLPCLLLLLDFWPLRRLRLPGALEATAFDPAPTTGNWPPAAPVNPWYLVLEKVPLLVLALVASVLTMYAQDHVGAVEPLSVLPYDVRLATAVVSYLHYLGMTVCPVGLAVFYPHPLRLPAWWEWTTACLVLLGITILSLGWGRRLPFLAVGWLWFAGTLLPVSGLMQAGMQARADRFTYVPHIGLILLIVWAGREWSMGRPRLRVGLVLASVVLLLACLAGTWTQVGFWRDSRTLWEHALEVTTDNYLAHNGVGIARAAEFRMEEAEHHFREALRINPARATSLSNLGVILLDRGELHEAVTCFERAIRCNPKMAMGHEGLGVALARQGKLDEAARQLALAIELDPESATAYHDLGLVYSEQGKPEEAGLQFRKALRIRPEYREARKDLAAVLARVEKLDEAAELIRAVLAAYPEDAEACDTLAMISKRQGQWETARHYFAETVRYRPRQAEAHANLGEVLAMLDRWDEAVPAYRQAVTLQPGEVRYRCGLALALAQTGQGSEADREFRESLRLQSDWPRQAIQAAWVHLSQVEGSPHLSRVALHLAQLAWRGSGSRDPECLDVLAAAHASTGQFEEAVLRARAALDRARATNRSDLAAGIQARLDLYSARKSFRPEPGSVRP